MRTIITAALALFVQAKIVLCFQLQPREPRVAQFQHERFLTQISILQVPLFLDKTNNGYKEFLLKSSSSLIISTFIFLSAANANALGPNTFVGEYTNLLHPISERYSEVSADEKLLQYTGTAIGSKNSLIREERNSEEKDNYGSRNRVFQGSIIAEGQELSVGNKSVKLFNPSSILTYFSISSSSSNDIVENEDSQVKKAFKWFTLAYIFFGFAAGAKELFVRATKSFQEKAK